MRAGIIAAAAAAFFQATFIGSAPSLAQSADGIREETLTIFGEPRDPSRARAKSPAAMAPAMRPPVASATLALMRKAAPRADITLAPEATVRATDIPSWELAQRTNVTMVLGPDYDKFQGSLSLWVKVMFASGYIEDVELPEATPPVATVTEKSTDELFTNQETQDQVRPLFPVSVFGFTSAGGTADQAGSVRGCDRDQQHQ
jgi:hypothetical protein